MNNTKNENQHFTGLIDDVVNGISIFIHHHFKTFKDGNILTFSVSNDGAVWTTLINEIDRFDNQVVFTYEKDMTEDDVFQAVDGAFKKLVVLASITWDESDYFEEGKDPDEISDDIAVYWDEFKTSLDDLFRVLLDDRDGLHIGASNLGWQKTSGEKTICFEDAGDFINEIFPKTDLTIRAKFFKDQAEFVVSHHDAPTGEFYKVSPVHLCEHCADVEANPDNKQEGTDDEYICDMCLDSRYMTEQQCFESFLGFYDDDKLKLKRGNTGTFRNA